MLPAAYVTPTAILLVVGGLLACFAGYRLFRFVLGVYGFVAGALVTSSLIGGSSTLAHVAAAIVGGVVGSLLMYAAYFIGVGLVGAGLAALALNVVWRVVAATEPPTIVLVVVCVLGALAALSVVRYVVIVGTALAGAWTAIFGGLAIMGNSAARHVVSGNGDWIVYPLDPMPNFWWIMPAWLVLAGIGVGVQLGTSKSASARAAKSAKIKK